MAILEYTESQFEATTIERLRALGYQYQPASTLDRDLKSVVLAGRPACAMHLSAVPAQAGADRLPVHVARRYPHPSTDLS